MTDMRAVRVHTFGDASHLKLENIPRPELPADGILIRQRATSVNPVDWKMRDGDFPPVGEDALPVTPGGDVAGVVEGVGASVPNFEAGDEVYGLIGIVGAYADYVIAKPQMVAKKPQTVDFGEAAAVPLAALTAWQGLIDLGGLAAGKRVLIHGGTGGVGHFAIQIAKPKGAWVATTVSGQEADFARELGADQVVDYKTERFEEVVEPVDIVFDLIAGDTQTRSFGIIKPGGALVSTLGEPDSDLGTRHGIRTAGFLVEPNADQLGELAALVDDGQVKITVQRRFPLEDIAAAQDMLEKEHTRGKIVVDISA